jgi:hypothetical protein
MEMVVGGDLDVEACLIKVLKLKKMSIYTNVGGQSPSYGEGKHGMLYI